VLAERCQVHQIAVYSQRDAVLEDSRALAALAQGEVDDVTLTSSNIARVFLESIDDAARSHLVSGRTGLVTISPVTSAEVRRLGHRVAAEATEATMAGIVEALVERAGRQASGA